ncbi:hypothetical protein C1645_825549 [Glomus cerebriforme]|uniref:Uncharacterized protein n=1 Tax=Glomus cerebriforme TaxID=658196 RepID=A0A397T190_9GLOM|nr:hypothetical protein C1645_825549 [Glomus cerebriforme]
MLTLVFNDSSTKIRKTSIFNSFKISPSSYFIDIFEREEPSGLSYSFKSLKILSSQQENSKLTGFPIWYNIDKSEASIAWFGYLIIVTFGSTIISLILTHNISIPNAYISYFIFPDWSSPDDNPPNVQTKSFNRILAHYTLFSFIPTLTLYILEPGKLWSSFDSFHNLLELIIILFLTLEGQIHKNKFIMFFICSTYIVLVNLLTITLSWPLDAIWFKSQGKILFKKIYFRTYLYIKHQETLQLPAEINNQINSRKFSKLTNQVILLPIAAFLHMFGNVATLFVHSTGNMIFMLSNAIAFLMYTFYIYLDTHYMTNISNSKHIVLPYTPTWKLVLIFLWSIILSAFIIRITALFF